MKTPRRTLPRRLLTVGYTYYPNSRTHGFLPPVPYIRLRGRWLQDAGFAVDQPVNIKVQRHRIVITPLDS